MDRLRVVAAFTFSTAASMLVALSLPNAAMPPMGMATSCVSFARCQSEKLAPGTQISSTSPAGRGREALEMKVRGRPHSL